MKREIIWHMLDALDTDLESYKRDHAGGMVDDHDMQIYEERYTEAVEFLLDELPRLQKAKQVLHSL